MSYPDTCQFILCEDTHQQADNNKLNIIGVFAGDNIVLNGQPVGGNLPSLCLMAIFRGGQGTYTLSAEIVPPNGVPNLQHAARAQQIAKPDPAQNLVSVFKWINFQVLEFGRYSANIRLDNQLYSYSFVIDDH